MENEYYCGNCQELREHTRRSSAQNPKPNYICGGCGEMNPHPVRGKDEVLAALGVDLKVDGVSL